MSLLELAQWILLGVLIAGVVRGFSLYWYGNWFRQGLMWDQAFHYAVVTHLQAGRRYEGVPAFLMKDEPDSYPILFHRFAALFPARTLRRMPWLPSFVLYCASTGLAAAYAHYLNATHIGASTPTFELGFIALYCLGVSNFVFNGNAILYLSLAERLLGRLTTSWYFFALAAALGFEDRPSLFIAVLAGGLAGISSMFARQAIAFTTPLVALFLIDPRPLAVLAGAFALALVLDRGYFLRGLRHMVEFSRAYLHYTKRSGWMKPALSRFLDWRKVLGPGMPLRMRLNELQVMEPTRAILHHVDVLILIALVVVAPFAALRPYAAIVAASATIYLLTSTAALNHLGEATRYLEFSLSLGTAFFLAASIALGSSTPAALAVVLLVSWTAAFSAWNLFNWYRFERHAETDELEVFVSGLRLGEGDTVFPVPFTLGGSIHIRAPETRVLMYQGSAVSRKVYARFCEDVPFLKRNWGELFREHSVTYVIALKYALQEMKRLVGWEYDFSGLQKVGESERYVAWRLPGDKMSSNS
jgi:hypothetical protein